MTNENRSSNCVGIAAKIVRFHSVNSEIIGQKCTKFVHDVAGLLSFNFLKVASQLDNPLSNARATSKGHSWRHL